jgi:predicted nucleic acid-binding protein
MIYFLDTNIFLRFLIIDDKKAHNECKALFELIEDKKVRATTSSIVFAEIVWVLGSFYKFPKSKINEALLSFIRIGIGFSEGIDMLQAMNGYETHNVKFIDALISANRIFMKSKAIIVSYDKDFDKLNMQRVTPNKIIELVH